MASFTLRRAFLAAIFALLSGCCATDASLPNGWQGNPNSYHIIP